MKQFVVQVFVPNEIGGDVGAVATGYPVAPNRILTTGHVLKRHVGDSKPEWTDDLPGVSVQWRLSEQQDQWQRIPARPVWWSFGSSTDAALLETAFPADVTDWAPVDSLVPQSGNEWESWGFPRATKRLDHRDAFPVRGTLARHMHDNALALDVNTGPKDAKDWGGASGAPVFVNNCVAAILRTAEQAVDRRLNAVLVSRLVEDDDFLEELGFCPELHRSLKHRREKVREDMSRLLRSNNDLLRAFGQIADPGTQLTDTNTDSVVESVCDFLLGQLERTMQAFADVVRSDAVELKSVQQLLTAVMPLIYPVATVQKLNQAIGASNSRIVSLPCGRPIGISIALAAIAGRHLQFDDLRGHGAGFVDLSGISTDAQHNTANAATSVLIDELKGFGPETGRTQVWHHEVAVILGTLATDPRYGMTLDAWDQTTAKSQKRLTGFSEVLNARLHATRTFSKEWAFFAYQGERGAEVSQESLDFIAKHIPGLVVVNMNDVDKSAMQRDMLITECVTRMIAQMEGQKGDRD